MNNLKRVLGLGLASVMLIGTMATGALAVDAKDFTDVDEISNKDAVSTMVALNVINGKEDGSYYDPAGTVTRAEMAKMITIMMNGGKDPVLNVNSVPTFTDIDGHWAEKYIEYCNKNGIIAGRGDGTFDPDGTVTGSQAAKMALTALGYDAAVFNFTGIDWEVNTNSYANDPESDLYDDLTGLNPSEPINRDNAAQLLYNTLDATVMKREYDKVLSNGEVSYNYKLDTGVSFMEKKFGAVKVEGIVIGNEVAYLESTDTQGSHLEAERTRIKVTNFGDGHDEQRYFGTADGTGTVTVVATTGLEELGRSVNVYIKKDSSKTKATIMGDVIVSADNVVVTNYSDKAPSKLAKDNDLSIIASTELATNYQAIATMTTADVKPTSGTETILIDNDDDGDVEIVLQNTYAFGKVTSYVSSGDGSIAVSVGSTVLSVDDQDDVMGFADVAKNDYVTAAWIGGRIHVAKAETVTGKLDSFKLNTAGTAATKLEVEGTNYSVSHITGYTSGPDNIRAAMTFNNLNLDNEAVFYLGAGGYVTAVGDIADNAYKYCLILAADTTGVSDQVKVALSDGTKATYNVNTNGDVYDATGTKGFDLGDVCAYTLSSNGTIKLTKVTASSTVNGSSDHASFTKGKTAVGQYNAGTTTVLGYTNSNTAFFYVDTTGAITLGDDAIPAKQVDVYTGYTGAPTLPAAGNNVKANIYTNTNGRVVAVVFAGTTLTTADLDDLIYIYDHANTNADYTLIDAFLAGDSERHDGDEALKLDVGDSSAEGVSKFTINSDGYYELETITTCAPGGTTGNLLVSTYNATTTPGGHTWGVFSSVGKTIVVGTWNAAAQNFSDNLMEIKINSETLYIDNSNDLEDPVAELGQAPDEGTPVAFLVFDRDSGAPDTVKMVVVKRNQAVSDAATVGTAANAQTALNTTGVSEVTLPSSAATAAINVPEGKTLKLTGSTAVDASKLTGTGTVNLGDTVTLDTYPAVKTATSATTPAAGGNVDVSLPEGIKLTGTGAITAFDPDQTMDSVAAQTQSDYVTPYKLTLSADQAPAKATVSAKRYYGANATPVDVAGVLAGSGIKIPDGDAGLEYNFLMGNNIDKVVITVTLDTSNEVRTYTFTTGQ